AADHHVAAHVQGGVATVARAEVVVDAIGVGCAAASARERRVAAGVRAGVAPIHRTSVGVVAVGVVAAAVGIAPKLAGAARPAGADRTRIAGRAVGIGGAAVRDARVRAHIGGLIAPVG